MSRKRPLDGYDPQPRRGSYDAWITSRDEKRLKDFHQERAVLVSDLATFAGSSRDLELELGEAIYREYQTRPIVQCQVHGPDAYVELRTLKDAMDLVRMDGRVLLEGIVLRFELWVPREEKSYAALATDRPLNATRESTDELRVAPHDASYAASATDRPLNAKRGSAELETPERRPRHAKRGSATRESPERSSHSRPFDRRAFDVFLTKPPEHMSTEMFLRFINTTLRDHGLAPEPEDGRPALDVIESCAPVKFGAWNLRAINADYAERVMYLNGMLVNHVPLRFKRNRAYFQGDGPPPKYNSYNDFIARTKRSERSSSSDMSNEGNKEIQPKTSSAGPLHRSRLTFEPPPKVANKEGASKHQASKNANTVAQPTTPIAVTETAGKEQQVQKSAKENGQSNQKPVTPFKTKEEPGVARAKRGFSSTAPSPGASSEKDPAKATQQPTTTSRASSAKDTAKETATTSRASREKDTAKETQQATATSRASSEKGAAAKTTGQSTTTSRASSEKGTTPESTGQSAAASTTLAQPKQEAQVPPVETQAETKSIKTDSDRVTDDLRRFQSENQRLQSELDRTCEVLKTSQEQLTSVQTHCQDQQQRITDQQQEIRELTKKLDETQSRFLDVAQCLTSQSKELAAERKDVRSLQNQLEEAKKKMDEATQRTMEALKLEKSKEP